MKWKMFKFRVWFFRHQEEVYIGLASVVFTAFLYAFFTLGLAL